LRNLQFPIPMNDLYQVWLKLACWKRRFLLFCYYLPLEKGNSLHLNNLESPQGWFVPSLVKIRPFVLQKKSKM
jgi:hypothetical protein